MDLKERLAALREPLQEMDEGRGPYKIDNHEFAISVIEASKENAKRVLEIVDALAADSSREAAAPQRHELAVWDAIGCKYCGLGIGYWPSYPECTGQQPATVASAGPGQADKWLTHCITRWLLDVREGHYEPDEQTAMGIIKEVRERAAADQAASVTKVSGSTGAAKDGEAT